jgi:hypothetical protein
MRAPLRHFFAKDASTPIAALQRGGRLVSPGRLQHSLLNVLVSPVTIKGAMARPVALRD